MVEKIINTTLDLIRFKSVAENVDQIEACLDYVIDYFDGRDVVIQRFEDENISPVLVISNHDGLDFDAMTLGHVDVVPAEDDQFEPRIEDGKLYGRGSMDMKGWIAVAMNTMDYILDNKLDVKFAIVITTDEETTATGAAYLAQHTDITAKILLDVDVADDISYITTKCKNVFMIDLETSGKACHGSLPWDGRDAIEKLIGTILNIRERIPYYAEDSKVPENVWVDTMHVGTISGGSASNVIAESAKASLDIRLTDKFPRDEFLKFLEQSLEAGVTYNIHMEAAPVIVDEKNDYFKKYKDCVERHIDKDVKILHIGGATDSRHLSSKGIPVAMHSGTGEGMHGLGEYCTIDSLEKLAEIQIDYIKSL